MAGFPERLLRRLAALLVRGPDAPFVLGDLEEARRRDLARGMSPGRIRIRYFGNMVGSAFTLARARFRHTPPRPFSPVSWLDLKLGARMLVKHPLLTAVSVFSLAVGIPVGLAPGRILDALEAPLPMEAGERIQVLRYRSIESSSTVFPTSYDFRVWEETLESFETLGAVRLVEHNLDAGTGGTPVIGAEVTGSTFRLLRARPLLGRTLDHADAAPGATPVVVLGEDLWRARLAGDPGAVGSTVRVAGEIHTVVGIMPSRFGFPVRQQMWLPLRETPVGEPGGGGRLEVYGRLAEGATVESARTELETVVRGMALEFPEAYGRLRAEVAPSSVAGRLGAPDGRLRGPEVWLLQLPGLALLLVACVNVGLLIFARAATRSSELAVRTALGASRTRIVAQVLTEAVVLAVVSACVGLFVLHVLATRHLDVALRAIGANLPYSFELGVTWTTVLRALVLAVLSAAAAALLPALRVTGKAVHLDLQRGRLGGDIRFGRISTLLVVADVAAAVAVVGVAVGIGDRIGELVHRTAVPGFPTEEYLAARVRLPASIAPFELDTARAAQVVRMARVQRELVERLEADPRVQGVGLASALPGMDHSRRFVEVENGRHYIDRGWVAPGFFDGLGQPLLAGRELLPSDAEGDRAAVIVNAAFVENVLRGGSPLGTRLRYPTDGETAQWYEIVGVAPNLGMDPLNPNGGAGVYHPAAPGELNSIWIAIHLGPNPVSFVPRLRELTAAVDAAAILEYPMALSEAGPADDRLVAIGVLGGSTLLAAILLALAASGIYAIMAFTVARRTHEIGVRAALGAGRGDIAVAIGRRAALQLGVGAAIGTPLAGQLYYFVQEDPSAKAAAVVAALVPGLGVMLLVGLLACTAPLVRALRIAPTEAMKVEG
jgi:predicted permease